MFTGAKRLLAGKRLLCATDTTKMGPGDPISGVIQVRTAAVESGFHGFNAPVCQLEAMPGETERLQALLAKLEEITATCFEGISYWFVRMFLIDEWLATQVVGLSAPSLGTPRCFDLILGLRELVKKVRQADEGRKGGLTF